MTSLFCSASTTASWTHFMAVSKSTISPLRTPREGACPTPRILSVPSGRPSPTTTQIFEVPISRPTIKSLLAILVFLLVFDGDCPPRWQWRFRNLRPRRRRRCRPCLGPMERDRFQNARRRLRFDRVVDNRAGRLGEGDWDISLHEQIDGRELLFRVIRVNQELLQTLQLGFEIIEPERDARVIFVRHQEAVA